MNDIKQALDRYPDFLTTGDLVKLGLYPSIDAAYLARTRGQSPDFMKMKRKVLYPKQSVIAFIENSMQRGDFKKGER